MAIRSKDDAVLRRVRVVQEPIHGLVEEVHAARTAAELAGTASKGAVSSIPIEGKGMMYRMRDGSVVSHRYTSRDGSPVVELKVKNTSGIRSQKIHFTRKGK